MVSYLGVCHRSYSRGTFGTLPKPSLPAVYLFEINAESTLGKARRILFTVDLISRQ